MASSVASVISKIIQLNASTQLQLKLTFTNFSSLHLQLETHFIGLDLLGYVNSEKPCPKPTIPVDEKSIVTDGKDTVSNPVIYTILYGLLPSNW